MKDNDKKFWILVTLILTLFNVNVFINSKFSKIQTIERKTESLKISIDIRELRNDVLDLNLRLNKGYIELYDDWSKVQVENDDLKKDNKYLRRITR